MKVRFESRSFGNELKKKLLQAKLDQLIVARLAVRSRRLWAASNTAVTN